MRFVMQMRRVKEKVKEKAKETEIVAVVFWVGCYRRISSFLQRLLKKLLEKMLTEEDTDGIHTT